MDDEAVWGVTPNQTVLRWNGTTWNTVLGGLMSIVTSGESGVWGIDTTLSVYYRTGTKGGTLSQGAGIKWKKIDGQLTWISSGLEGIVWGVFSNRTNTKVFKREGITEYKPEGTNWKEVEGELIQLDVLGDTVWGVNKDNEVVFYNIEGK